LGRPKKRGEKLWTRKGSEWGWEVSRGGKGDERLRVTPTEEKVRKMPRPKGSRKMKLLESQGGGEEQSQELMKREEEKRGKRRKSVETPFGSARGGGKGKARVESGRARKGGNVLLGEKVFQK